MDGSRKPLTPKQFAKKRPTSQNVLTYFDNLPNTPNKIEHFAFYWDALKDFEFDARQISTVLHKTALSYRAHKKPFNTIIMPGMVQNIAEWEEYARPQIKNFSHLSITLSLKAFDTLAMAPRRETMEALETRLPQVIDDFTASNITITLRAFGQLGHVPKSETLAAIKTRIETLLENERDEPEIKPSQKLRLSSILRALAILHSLASETDKEIIKPIAAILFEQCEQTDPSLFTQNDKNRLNLAYLWFKGETPLPFQDITGIDDGSSWEEYLAKELRQKGVPLRNELTHIKRLAKKTDHAFQTAAGIVHLEDDGDYHFIRHVDGRITYDGQTIFMTKLSQKLRPSDYFVRLPFITLNNAQRHMGQRRAIQTIAQLLQSFEHAARAHVPYVIVPDTNRQGVTSALKLVAL